MTLHDKTRAPDFRPPAALILKSAVHFTAFGFGSGLSPKAPGTMGTLAAIPLFFLLSLLPWPLYAAITAAAFAFGCWVCGESARRLGVHDYGGIVFDEIVGYWVAAAPLLFLRDGPWSADGAIGAAVAFGAFRLFDIWKPWPIRVLDRKAGGGFGIMVDDLVAGIEAAVVLDILIRIADW